jgi:cytoskeletal protein CcmA (bactofilin family)
MRSSVLSLVLISAFCACAGATPFVKSADFTLPAKETRSEELWLLTETGTVAGVIRQDCFAAGWDLSFPGSFEQDLWAAGAIVRLSGQAANDARLVGETVEVSGEVLGNLAVAGSSVQLATNAAIHGEALLVGESVVAEGRVEGNTRILASRVTLSGRHVGNVRLIAEDIAVMPGTQIKGNLTYTSSKDLFLDQKVILGGELIRKDLPKTGWSLPTLTSRQSILLQGILYLCAIAAAIPFVAVFPRFSGRAVRILRGSAWRCALAGFVAFSLMPMLGLFALLSVIGLPLGLILFALYFVLLYLAQVVIALAMAGALLRRRGPQPFGRLAGELVMGLSLVYLLTNLPMIGGAVWLLILFLGLGAMVLALFSPQEVELPPAPALDVSTKETRSSEDHEEPSNKE